MMKKLISIIFASFSLLFLMGCQAKITAPTDVVLNNRVLTWSAVKDASSYIVNINDDLITVDTTTYSLASGYYGILTISVKAVVGAEETPYSTPLSATVTYTCQAPEHFVQSGNRLFWDTVINAQGYIVKINGTEYVTTENQYTLSSLEGVSVSVLAVGSLDGYILPSVFSETYLVLQTLNMPTNITNNQNVISWSEVPNASGYSLLVNGVDAYSVSVASIDLRYLYVGSISIQIQAISSDLLYLDSAIATMNTTISAMTLATPLHLQVVGSLLSFDPVPYANSYDIYVSGEYYETIVTNAYSIPAVLLETEGATLQVQAKSTLHHASLLSEIVVLSLQSISTEAELRNITLTGSYQLVNDITLTSEWIPIAFSGYFDGNDHTISGISILTGESDTGFFSEVDEATIKHLTLVGSMDVTCLELESRVGGLAGRIRHSLLSDITVQINIIATSENGIGVVGGISGEADSSQFSNIRYFGNITGENMIVGGFIGQTMLHDEIDMSITSSSASGNLTSLGGLEALLGGFVGKMTNNQCTITQSFYQGALIGTGIVGGFTGYLGSGTIQDAYAIGQIDATLTSFVKIGGFIGQLEGYNNIVTNAIADMEIAYDFQGDNVFVGGFVGTTPGGTFANIYSHCVYNQETMPFDRIGNPSSGRGDGITAISTNQYSTLSDFDPLVWNLTSNVPQLRWEDSID